MDKKRKVRICYGVFFLGLFSLWTYLLRIVDVQSIGPRETAVGFATLNQFFHNITGVHMSLYHITDWLGLVPVFLGFGFAILGLAQWIKRNQIRKVDYDILVFGGYYLVVLAAYLFFERFVINYRPVLIDGFLEASYPSSTTLLVLCVVPTSIMQFYNRIKCKLVRCSLCWTLALFVVFMVLGRLLSGVHWLSDMIGGILLSVGLVMLYYGITYFKSK